MARFPEAGAVALLAAMLGAWTEPARTLPAVPDACRVLRIVDGDTIAAECIAAGPARLRLRGVDTPERGEPRHREAADALAAMLARCGWSVTMTPHHMTRGRIAATVECGGQDIGRAMDRAGWSKPIGARR